MSHYRQQYKKSGKKFNSFIESRLRELNYKTRTDSNSHSGNEPPKTVNTAKVAAGLPSVYQFSWQVFNERSYVDSINSTDDLDTWKAAESAAYLKKWIDNACNPLEEDQSKFLQERFYIQENNYITDGGSDYVPKEQRSSYESVLNKLKVYSQEVLKVQEQLTHPDTEYVTRQNKLLIVALSKACLKFGSTYKVSHFHCCQLFFLC